MHGTFCDLARCPPAGWPCGAHTPPGCPGPGGALTCILLRNALNLGLLCSACNLGGADGRWLSSGQTAARPARTLPNGDKRVLRKHMPTAERVALSICLPPPVLPWPPFSPPPRAAGTAPAPRWSDAPACAAQGALDASKQAGMPSQSAVQRVFQVGSSAAPSQRQPLQQAQPAYCAGGASIAPPPPPAHQ